MKWLLRLLWSAVKKPVSWWRFRTRIKSVAVEELPDRLHRRRLPCSGRGSLGLWRCPCGAAGPAEELRKPCDINRAWLEQFQLFR